MSGKGQLTKKVNQYDLDGKFIKTWSSVSEAAKGIKGSISSISRNARGDGNKHASKFLWRYIDDPRKMGTEHDPKYNKKKTQAFVDDVGNYNFNHVFSVRNAR